LGIRDPGGNTGEKENITKTRGKIPRVTAVLIEVVAASVAY